MTSQVIAFARWMLHPVTISITEQPMPKLFSVLRANYLFSTVTGLGLMIGSEPLAEWSGVLRWVLVVVGGGLLPFAAFVRSVSQSLDEALVKIVIAGDVMWVLAAAVILIGFPDSMTTPGKWALGLVSVAVADFAFFQWRGLVAAS